ncbi:MAG: DUF1820 family protein [Pseudomonadota bacterium]
MKSGKRTLYRVKFMGQNKLYEVYAEDVYQGDLYGFVVLEGLVFGEHTTVVIDPEEEKLKSEFDGVTQTVVPMHAIVRIDEVEKEGVAKVTELSGNITPFPSPVYTPKGGDNN